MLNKVSVLDAIEVKIAGLAAQIAEDEAANKSVGRLKRQSRALKVISALIDDFIDDEDFEFSAEADLMQMVDCKKGKVLRLTDLHEGMKIFEIMQKHENLKYAKLKQKIEEAGFKVVLDHIEKA